MNLFRPAALAALVALLSSPAFAHHDVVHDGCPTGQSFALGDLTVTGAFTRETPPSAQAAGGYLTVANSGASADTLTGASSEAVKAIEIHEMKMNGDVMEMTPVEGGLEVPAGGSVALEPMGYHLMMMGLDQSFHEGECVNVTLHFAKAGDLPIQLNVGKLGSDSAPTGDAPAHDMGDMSSMSN